MKKTRKTAPRTAPVQRPNNVSAYQADAAGGKYSTARPSVVAATHPPILAMGDALQPTTIAVTQISYLMAFNTGQYIFPPTGDPGSLVRVGNIGSFDMLAPIGQGIPTVWRDGSGALQPAWQEVNGRFKSSADAPPFTASIDIQGVMSVNASDVDLEFTLRDINNTPPNDIVSSGGDFLLRNVNSPTPLRVTLKVDERSADRIRFLPGVEYGVYVERLDGGGSATVTIEQYRQEVISVGVA
jgi:hypothetical protein